MSGQRATRRHRLRYGLVILLLLLPSCNEAQTESTNVTEDLYAISLEPRQSQDIEEGNQIAFTCSTSAQFGWSVSKSNGDIVADYNERGIERDSNILSIPANRQNDGLWVNCFIASNTSIRSEKVQLNVIFIESTDPPNSTVATGTINSTTTGEEETLATTESDDDDDKRRRDGIIIGIVVGGVVLLIMFGVVLCCIRYVCNGGQQLNVNSTMGADTNSNSQQNSVPISVAKSQSKASEEKTNTLKEPQVQHLVTIGGENPIKRSERPRQHSRELNAGSVLPQGQDPDVALQSFNNGFGSQSMTETGSKNVPVGSAASFAQETEGVAVTTCFVVGTSTGVLFRQTLGAAKSPNTVHHVEESVCIAIDDTDST